MQKSTLVKIIFIALFISNFSFEASAQVVINEGSNRNFSSISDEDGEYPDWIEIYNTGTDTIDLYNYSLTDDITLPAKWTFPHINLLAGEYKTVFCSGKDRKPISGFINVINTGAFSPSVGWNTHTFTTPFYWDGISNILINTCSFSSTGYITNSVFNQSTTSFPSTVVAFQDGSPAACSLGYGTVVNQRPNMQLNGVAIGNGTIQNCNTCYPAPYGNWYWGAKNQMLILASELTASGLTAGNITSLGFDVASTDPVNYDYIDINMKLVSTPAISSSFVPVDPNNNQHTNFKITGNGGELIYLFSPTLVLEDSLFVNCTNLDNSIGSFPDASATIALFQAATPTATNNLSIPYSGYLLAPTYDVASGFYFNAQTVTIDNPNTIPSTIHYTLNGDDPTDSSALYSGPITVFYSCVLKARAFASGTLPSPIVVSSYFFGVNHETPILSVVTDHNNIYGATGIFDNWWSDWQKPAYVEYFDSTHQLIFSQPSGIQMDGGAGGSRSNPQHSFRVELANDVLGGDAINYKVIPDRPNRTKYSNFYLRNGSNQYLAFPYKDACQVKSMCGETNNYYSAWRPVSVYVNGGYFGLYELREKFDDEYFKTLEGANSTTTEILSLSYWYGQVLRALSGSVDSFYSSYSSYVNLNTSDTGFWNQADHYFDMKYYEDYIIGQSWMGNVDWPGNNIKIYRSDKTNERWRFCTVDLELAMGPNSWTDCTFDHINYLLTQDPNNPYINIWLKGIQNNRFRDYFINRFADVMNTAYKFNNLSAIENNFFSGTVLEMQNEYARWGDPANIPGQMNNFYNNHLVFLDQLSQRSNIVRNQIQANAGLPQQVDLTLDVFPAGAGKIHISTIEPDTYPWEGIYFDGLPVKIEAIANAGFHFINWGNNPLLTNILNPVFLDTLSINAVNFTAYFDVNVSAPLVADESREFSLYPNPAKNELYISNNKNENYTGATYEIVDLNGRIILNGKLNETAPQTLIDIRSLAASAYLLRIRDVKDIPQQFRFVKTND